MSASDLELCSPWIPNTDISGIGTRLSFYAQTIILLGRAWWTTQDVAEMQDSLYITIVMNAAYCIVTLCLGFKPGPSLAPYDGVMVCYLVSGSWLAAVAILPLARSPYKLWKSSSLLRAASIIQSYLVFGTVFAIVFTSGASGPATNNGTCEDPLVLALFGPFKATRSGQIVVCCVLGTAIGAYTYALIRGELGHPTKSRKISSIVAVTVLFINAELFHAYNHPEAVDLSLSWGQLITLVALLWELKNAAAAFGLFGALRMPCCRRRKTWSQGPIALPAREPADSAARCTMILNEHIQKYRGEVTYEDCREGPDHQPTWTVKVKVGENPLGAGTAADKKTAKERAARQAVEALGLGEV